MSEGIDDQIVHSLVAFGLDGGSAVSERFLHESHDVGLALVVFAFRVFFRRRLLPWCPERGRSSRNLPRTGLLRETALLSFIDISSVEWRGHCTRTGESPKGWGPDGKSSMTTDARVHEGKLSGQEWSESPGGGQNFQGFYCGVGREKDCVKDGLRHGSGGHHFASRSLWPESMPDIGVGGARVYADHTNA